MGQLVGAYMPAARRSGAAIRLVRDTLMACGVTRTGRASGAADKGGEELFALWWAGASCRIRTDDLLITNQGTCLIIIDLFY